MFKELDVLFESSTIKPTFERVHIILALLIFGENREGIGRYRLKEELLIGSGTARSLITKLRNAGFIDVPEFSHKKGSENLRRGHVLTVKGLRYLEKINEYIPFVREGDLSKLKEIIIESEGINPYICQVKDRANKITNGIDQRDAAIKIDGNGATCLIFNGEAIVFPQKSISNTNKDHWKISDKVSDYFIKLKNERNNKGIVLEKNDVIIIGLGNSVQKARLAALNAALTLI